MGISDIVNEERERGIVIWKEIKGYEKIYLISSSGQIRSLERLVNRKRGYYKRKERILSQSNDKYGYPKVVLQKEGKRNYKNVHRLVAENFLPNPNNLPQVNHIDGNKENNNVINLEWCTGKENMNHAHENGLFDYSKTSGENCYITNLTNETVLEIREKMKNGVRNKDIEKEYGLSRSTVSRIKMRKSFKNI